MSAIQRFQKGMLFGIVMILTMIGLIGALGMGTIIMAKHQILGLLTGTFLAITILVTGDLIMKRISWTTTQ